MAIPTNIKTLLSGDVVEWARIEFKETWDPATSLKTVCAFANDLDNWGSGYIVIGVKEDNGRPMYPLLGVPLDKLDAYQKDIYAKCKLIRPAYTPIIGIETYQDKTFIILWCPGGDSRPLENVKAVNGTNSTLKRAEEVFLEEINWIEKMGIKTLDEYEKVERVGRFDTRIIRENRKYFFQVYKAYLEVRKEEG